MNYFLNKNNSHNFCMYLAILIFCLLSSDVLAQYQSLNPIPLAPPKKLAPLKEPISKTYKEDLEENLVESPKQVGGVKIDSLQTIDPDTAGTLTLENGGFGADMWLGTDRSIIEDLLPQLPVNATSNIMRDLMKRMLLSIARVPEGKAKKTSLVAIRIRLLAAMGDLVSVNTLLNATPGRAANPELVRIETETRFLANDNARACALAGSDIRDQDNLFWQKVFLFCQALAGEHEKAALGISIMRETGSNDEVFFSMIESLSSGTPPIIEELPDPTPLSLAVARVAKAKLPADVITSNHPGILRTIAISPNATVEIRLEAAERAESAGALPVDALRQLYSIVSFSSNDLANPLSRAESEGGPMTRALLYHTSLTQTIPTAQAEVVARALTLGRVEGRYVSVVRVFLPVLKSIPPSAELLWFASEAIRGLLLVGETVAADAWFSLIRTNALFNKEAEKALIQLMPVIRLMGASEALDWNTTKLLSWWEITKNRKDAFENAELLFSLFDALGEPVPDEAWSKLLVKVDRRKVSMPNVAQWLRLIEATKAQRETATKYKLESMKIEDPNSNYVEEGALDLDLPDTSSSLDASNSPKTKVRIGELVMLGLLALGEGGVAEADPLLLSQVILGLRAAGFENEARLLAVEAALAAGL
jgi:hypothetical protein